MSNDLGTDFSIYFTKNYAGIDYGFRYDIFNFVTKIFRYDTTTLNGFSIQINLIMIIISIVLFCFYTKIRTLDSINPV